MDLRQYSGVKDKLRVWTSGTLYIEKYENESDELEDERPLLPLNKTEDVLQTVHTDPAGGHRGYNST